MFTVDCRKCREFGKRVAAAKYFVQMYKGRTDLHSIMARRAAETDLERIRADWRRHVVEVHQLRLFNTPVNGAGNV